ncbi:uL15 family ribosomal protein [Candidatus Micrarchaeota archaeon]|nr:uL15 family ribosomal protein [Candidatus Micrarchaeota archaeon]
MARRIKSRMRKHLGNRTHGGGNTKNRRGKGNKGGVGNAGAGKHNWLRTIKTVGTNKKDKGITGFHNPNATKMKEITLSKLNYLIDKSKIKTENNEVVLKGFKVLSNGTLTHKVKIIKAKAFTAGAEEKLKALGIATEKI